MKYFLKYLNPLFFLMFSYVTILLQSTILHQIFGIYKPMLILILVSYWALSRYAMEGAILSFLAGYILSIHSSGPASLYPCLLVMTFFVAKGTSLSFLIHSIIGEMGFVVSVSILYKLFFLIMMSMAGPIHDLGSTLASTLMMAFLNFLLTPIFFFFFKSCDEFSGKESSVQMG